MTDALTTDALTIVIGPSDFLPGLKERAGAINGEVLTFTDVEALRASEIRVLEHNSDYSRVIPRPAAAAPAAPALDQRGTRRAPRIKITEKVTILVDGKSAVLIDLSTVGAQAVSSGALKPNQRVDVVFNDNIEKVKCVATVVWTSFEMAGAGGRYRAGLDFVDADGGPIGAYAQRHKV